MMSLAMVVGAERNHIGFSIRAVILESALTGTTVISSRGGFITP